jgi:WD40 repeat protein
MDGTSKYQIKSEKAHTDEIVNLSFYDAQYQIITVSISCQVCLWDAQKLENIQTIRDSKQAALHNSLSSAFFYKNE